VIRIFKIFFPPLKAEFLALVDKTQAPVLIIDNIQNVYQLKQFMSAVKEYANRRAMKIVLVCSSSMIAHSISELSSSSRGQVHLDFTYNRGRE